MREPCRWAAGALVVCLLVILQGCSGAGGELVSGLPRGDAATNVTAGSSSEAFPRALTTGETIRHARVDGLPHGDAKTNVTVR